MRVRGLEAAGLPGRGPGSREAEKDVLSSVRSERMLGKRWGGAESALSWSHYRPLSLSSRPLSLGPNGKLHP